MNDPNHVFFILKVY